MKIKCLSKRKLNVRKIQISTNLQPFNFNPQQDLKITAFWENPEKIDQNLAKIQENSGKICKIMQKSATFQQFFTKKLRLENGAKECIVQISARAFQRIFTCKIWLRYSRERAL